jgi:hypothetical protein
LVAAGLSLVGAIVAMTTLVAKPTPVGVLVETEPVGARISLDGTPVQGGIVTLLSPGVHELVVSAPGRKIERRTVELQRDQPAKVLRVKLEPLAWEVALTSPPLLHGAGGSAPEPDLKPIQSRKDVVSPPRRRPSARLTGKLACRSFPAGAEVWVDGKYSGRSTPISIANPLELPVGTHLLLFKMPDGTKQSAKQAVQIRHNEITKLINVPLNLN